MKKLDRTKHYSRITPPWDGDNEFDRPAHFEQDGSYFDAQDREIIAGQPLEEEKKSRAKASKAKKAKVKEVAAPPPDEEDDDECDEGDEDEDGDEDGDEDEEGEEVNAAGGKSAAQVLAEYDSRQIAWNAFQKEAKRILGGDCPAGKAAIVKALQEAAAKGKSHKPAPERGTKQEDPTGGIDLAAWGTGQKDYLFDEVRKAIRKRFNAVATDRRAALEVLLDEGIITGDSARKDV